MNEKEKETMERVIKKATSKPSVAEAAAIFASGYAAGMEARPEESKDDQGAKPA